VASPPDPQSAAHVSKHLHQSFWLWVMCLSGVDYFSTLGYQPSIAFEAAGRLAPLATLVLVLVTLFGALPVYRYVAGESPHGQGSIAMLEHLLHGWPAKFLVLVLLGFAATDFVITKTLSAADAAEHIIHNPWWKDTPAALHSQMTVTMLLLVMLGAVFLRGFSEVIAIAVVFVGVYLVLNLLVIGSGLVYMAFHADLVSQWWAHLLEGDWQIAHEPLSSHGPWAMVLVSLILFPKLALGLSGFETGVAVMPLVRGDDDDDAERPAGRIRNTRKLLLTAAAIMSCFLLGSSLVTATLIEPAALVGGPAENRALAYLAHGEGKYFINPAFGQIFGTIYDVSTVAILWFAGASAMSGLLNLVPRYLPRYGMAPEWATAVRPLVILFTLINLLVTWIFGASVTAQGAAYATGVLVLMSSACVASVIDQWRKRSGGLLRRTPWPMAVIALVFFYTTVANVVEKPDGIKIASCFIAAIIVSSMASRVRRSTELRFIRFEFVDDQSRVLWDTLKYLEFPVLVPHRPGRRSLMHKEEDIRRIHRLPPEVPIVYIEAQGGDASEFYQTPRMEVTQEEGRFIIRVSQSVSIAHVIAAVALELSKHGRPPEIHFGWSDEMPLAANLRFVLFGEGNVPWLVRELIRRAEPDPERQPHVVIG
jgi:hypothetical protein